MSCFIMEPDDLKADELIYEMEIRSMEPDIRMNGVKALRRRLCLEFQGKAVVSSKEWSCVVSNEIQICFDKVEDLEGRLILASVQPDRPEKILVLISRFNHVKYRLKRLFSLDKRELKQIKILSEKVFCYLAILDSVRQGNADLEEILNSEGFWAEMSYDVSEPQISDVVSREDISRSKEVDLIMDEVFNLGSLFDENKHINVNKSKKITFKESKPTYFPYVDDLCNQSFFRIRIQQEFNSPVNVFKISVKDSNKVLYYKFYSRNIPFHFSVKWIISEIGEFGMLKYIRRWQVQVLILMIIFFYIQ